MQRFELVSELRSIHIRQWEIEGELKTFLKSQIEHRRLFKDGQKVEVFDTYGKSKGIGLIGGAHIGASFNSAWVKIYAEKPEKWEEDLNDIYYTVWGIKKDGTASSRRLCWERPHQTPKYGDTFLKVVE